MKFLRSKRVFHESDERIVLLYKETGDSLYLGVLFDRYSHLIFAVCMNYLKNEEDSKDAVICIFEKLAEDFKKYKVENFSGWLHVVTKNYCFKLLNKKIFFEELKEGDIPEYFESNSSDMEDLQLSLLGDALLSLSELQRKCIDLFYFQEKSYKEIEQITGYEYNEVKSYIQNGKRNLRMYLKKKNGQL